MKFLLDYVFKVSSINPTPAASTAFLKQLCVVVKPLTPGVGTGVITACTTQSAIAALTANLEAQQALNAGMSKVYILPMDDLGLSSVLSSATDFYTVVISSDFDGNDEDSYASGNATITSYANLTTAGNDTISVAGVAFTAQTGAATLGTATFQAATSNNATATSLAAQINGHPVVGAKVVAVANAAVVTITSILPGYEGHYALAYTDNGTATIGATVSGATLTGGEEALDVGTFGGVIGRYRQDATAAGVIAAIENHAGFFSNNTTKAKNMIYAFGKLLSNALNWRNQQYISMPLGDGVASLGDAESLFDDKVSFTISDDEYSHRLGLFAAGGKAIVAPYITRNLQIDMQSTALSYIASNQPQYTKKAATQLENALQDVIQLYIQREWITDGSVSILLEQDNFVASGYINISEPTALWRVFSEMQQTL